MRTKQDARATSIAFALVIGIALVAGCGKTETPKPQSGLPSSINAPDPDDVAITEADVKMPANYAEAMDRVKSYRDAIRSAVQDGAPTKAHRPLDELDIVLNKIPSIARDSDVPKADWETVNTTARELRDLFNQVHSAIDEKREPDYKAVSEGIEKAIDRLAEFTPASGI